jgi:hypothetical protein
VVKKRRGLWLPGLAAALLLVGLALIPWLTPTGATPPWVAAARAASPVPLPRAPAIISPLALSSIATPTQPQSPPASQPVASGNHQAALVIAEDNRLRSLLQHASRLTAPTIVDVPGSLATLVLPARVAPYTFGDLESAGVAEPLNITGWYLLLDSVLVAPSATLDIAGNGLSTLLLDSNASGFTSLVTWGGILSITGTAEAPISVMGWDSVNSQPAADAGYGRPYIRAVGGQLDLDQVRASSLGFWSGRTGGVAWTGISTQPTTGEAVSSTFTDDTYGAFVTSASQVQFSDDLFESNELDGLRFNRNTAYSSVSASAAARNGGNGFVISRGASNDSLVGDEAVHNAGNGFLLDGQPLVSGASPSGGQIEPSTGNVLNASEALANGRSAILVEGGSGTVVDQNLVCSSSTGIAIRLGADLTSVVGNEVQCGGSVALSIGPSVTGTTVSANTLIGAHIGILIRSSPGVRLLTNQLTRMTVFAISVRGDSPGVVGSDNVVAGQGFDPINTQSGATAPLLVNTNSKAWVRRSDPTFFSYLRYHPLLTTWLVILLLVVLCWIGARVRRRPAMPYAHVVNWRPNRGRTLVVPVDEMGLAVDGHAEQERELVGTSLQTTFF